MKEREIEFRGIPVRDVEDLFWDKILFKESDFVYGNSILDGNKQWIVGGVAYSNEEYIILDFWCPVKPETVGQYIGRKDKHGTKIFTGDILGGTIGNGIVCWDDEGARFAISICGEINEVRFEELEQEDLEVIGNIYKNPELLEE